MTQEKVLIITYYWPPSGGAGVQRWLKFTKYLSRAGVEVHVLTVNPDISSYTSFDNSLINDIDEKIKIHKTNSFEIINYYSKLVGKKNIPTSGFSNVNNAGWIQKVATSIRSNFFIPDPRIGWNRYAYKKAKEIIIKENIKSVITSSPPHSTQLIGYKLKRNLNINWIADMRDPWTDIYYYNLLRHSFFSDKINRRLENKVFQSADTLITVSKGLKKLFKTKFNPDVSHKTKVIYNGFDPEDFSGLFKQKKDETFTITYTGTMSDQYNPFNFFKALDEVCQEINDVPIKFQFVGSTSESIKNYVEQLNFHSEFINTVPHSEINQFQVDADLLLLVIPETKFAEGIATGKFFEYLASGNDIVVIGLEKGDVVDIIKDCDSGKSFSRSDILSIKKHLHSQIKNYKNKVEKGDKTESINRYSRKFQANQVKQLL